MLLSKFIMHVSKFFITFFLIVLTEKGIAQPTKIDPTDRQGWVVSKFALDLRKKWKVEAEYQRRYYKNISAFYGSFYGLNVQKKLSKRFTLEADYMLSKIFRGTYNSYSAGFSVDKKLGELKSDLRVLYQNQTLDYYKVTRETTFKNIIRARFRFRYPIIKKFDVTVSTEPIWRYQSSFKIDNYRHEISFKYSPAKQWDCQVFYINRPDYSKSYRRQFHIFGLGLNYQLKL